MDKDFLFTHALSIWRTIEAEGRAFPAINISVGLSGFGEIEDKVQGIQGFLVPGRQTQTQSLGQSSSADKSGEVLRKRKRDDAGIAKFFGKKDDHQNLGVKEDSLEDACAVEEDVHLPDETELEEQVEIYLCPKCQKQISIVEMEIHEDYHVALDLSRGSPIRAPPVVPAKATSVSKKGKKEVKKDGKSVEKGQMKLPFGV
jgi:DNA polymerase eta